MTFQNNVKSFLTNTLKEVLRKPITHPLLWKKANEKTKMHLLKNVSRTNLTGIGQYSSLNTTH